MFPESPLGSGAGGERESWSLAARAGGWYWRARGRSCIGVGTTIGPQIGAKVPETAGDVPGGGWRGAEAGVDFLAWD